MSLNWTEAQWNRVNSAVTEEFTKSSVAGALLSCYGPVDAEAESVSRQMLEPLQNSTLKIKDHETTRFWTIRVLVELNGPQAADEDLSSALFAFRRAASMLARTEDFIVFNGYDSAKQDAARKYVKNLPKPPEFVKQAVATNSDHCTYGLCGEDGTTPIPVKPSNGGTGQPSWGENLVGAAAKAIVQLEGSGYAGPFGSAFGPEFFTDAQNPCPGSLVLPADRITPMLNGLLLRSGSLGNVFAVVVPTAIESVDLVVATPPRVQFLQMTPDAKYLFRVYERFALRIKDRTAVAVLEKVPGP